MQLSDIQHPIVSSSTELGERPIGDVNSTAMTVDVYELIEQVDEDDVDATDNANQVAIDDNLSPTYGG
ncbi:MAG: hypothetical protein ABJM29_12725 [Rhizobiaceae bacterium]